ncbi:hypothetical protein MES4922_110198 [Mesorhizobium ventifaucium]|uniref:Uncharacterized protein n=1 Tax=Mesorhizobium ventifaucium TaxID=666020 RepID=A0ABM9DDX4_9HYPH|nr:hypothetical protein MES4922_110198 [Mesorhizobium ventifaucium]
MSHLMSMLRVENDASIAPGQRLEIFAEGEPDEMRFDDLLGLGQRVGVGRFHHYVQRFETGIHGSRAAGEPALPMPIAIGDLDLVREMLAKLLEIFAGIRRFAARDCSQHGDLII